jgi:hypothetical protein
MKKYRKLFFWLLPLTGLLLGYACAYVVFNGLAETWHLIGQPAESLVQILGTRDADKFLATTETGQIYSFEYPYRERVAHPPQISWEREQDRSVDPVRQIQYYGADFVTLPAPFQVKQLFEMEYIYRAEGKGQLKLALDPDGNLWVWDHKISGLTCLVFFYYPVMGFIIGLAAVLLVYGSLWIRARQGSLEK